MKLTRSPEGTGECPDAENFQLREELSRSTGWLRWGELARHFARGVVLVVSPQLELLEAARVMAVDDRATFAFWLGRGLVAAATDDHARFWEKQNSELLAIVVAPWVLVQLPVQVDGCLEGRGD